MPDPEDKNVPLKTETSSQILQSRHNAYNKFGMGLNVGENFAGSHLQLKLTWWHQSVFVWYRFNMLIDNAIDNGCRGVCLHMYRLCKSWRSSRQRHHFHPAVDCPRFQQHVLTSMLKNDWKLPTITEATILHHSAILTNTEGGGVFSPHLPGRMHHQQCLLDDGVR